MIFLRLLEPLGADFVVYFEAAEMFVLGLNPYRGLFTRTFPYNYPPTSSLFVWPLALFDYRVANVIWNLSSLLSVLASVWLLLKMITNKVNLFLYVLLCLLFTLPFFPVKFNIGNGQINHFVLLFFVLSIYFYERYHKSVSALLLAFATGIKFAPAVLVLYFLIKKDWRQVFRYVVFLVVVFLLALVFVPLSFELDYYQKVLPLSFSLAAKDWYYNQSLEGFLARSLSQPIVILVTTYLLTAAIVFLTWYRGKKINKLRAISAVSCLYLILHPIALQHYFSFAIIPLVLLAGHMGKHWQGWLALIGAYFLIAFDIKNFDTVPKEFNFVLSHDFYGIFLLWLLALWKENIWKIVGAIWIAAVALAYILVLLCRAKICF